MIPGTRPLPSTGVAQPDYYREAALSGHCPRRLYSNDDGDDEHEDRSDENDGQCVPQSGPQERSDYSDDRSRGDASDNDLWAARS